MVLWSIPRGKMCSYAKNTGKWWRLAVPRLIWWNNLKFMFLTEWIEMDMKQWLNVLKWWKYQSSMQCCSFAFVMQSLSLSGWHYGPLATSKCFSEAWGTHLSNVFFWNERNMKKGELEKERVSAIPEKFSWLRKPRKDFRVSVDDISLRKQLA